MTIPLVNEGLVRYLLLLSENSSQLRIQALAILMRGGEGVEDGYEWLLIMAIPLVNEGLVR